MIQWILAFWFLVPLPFLNPAWTSGSPQFTYCWSPAWRILSITLLACEMNAIVQLFEHSLGLPFFGIGMKTDIFQSCGHCWVFQICWHIECSTFTPSSFRIWNSSVVVEYYSAIKKNAFESVLVRWVNLEPIIQSKVSQKEKNKYHILSHIYLESRKVVLMNLFAGKE